MSPTLLHAWEKVLRRRGAARAVVQAADGQTCTFRQLDARATAWLAGHAPTANDALRGQAVVFTAPNGIGWLEIFLGLMHAGAVAVPLDPGEPPAEQRRLAVTLRAGFLWEGGRLVPLAGARRYRNPAVCLIKLTSGTTGQPRPLVFTAAQLLSDTRQISATMGISPRDLNYALIPFGHSYGLGNLTLQLIARGVPLVCGTAPLPHAIAEDFSRWRPSVFPGVPPVFHALAATGVAPAALASLRLAISAGAPLPPATARDFVARFDRPVHNFYGSSETGGISFDRTGGATLAGGVGRPLRGVRVTLLPGQRLRVTSAAVFTQGNRRGKNGLGVWNPPDLASVDIRGGLTLLGRRSTTVKIGGRRVNLTEVTARLRQLPGVHDAWVGVNPEGEPVLGAAVITARAARELQHALQGATAPWKIPKKWAVLPQFPLTARGKVDTRALQQRLFGPIPVALPPEDPKVKSPC